MANATVTGASLSGIYDRLNGVSGYHPISANTFADWSIQAGDIVSVIRGEDSYESPVHTSRMVWKGAPEIELNSTGNKEREAITKVARKKYGRGSSAINEQQQIYKEFTSSDGLLYSAIYMSASILRTEFYASESTIYSYIEQTASGIRQVVANTASGLQSSINQQANRISLVVEGTGSNAHIKPASIVEAINDSSSTVKISADHIILDGNAVAESLSATEISVTGVTATYVTPLVLDLADARIETDHYEGTIDSWIVAAAVESGVLHLMQADGNEVTFEKAGSATSLSGSWSGRTYTVTASPQGNTISEPVTIHVDYPQGSPPTSRTRIWVATSTGSGSGYIDHGDPTTLYMVPSNLTVSLKSANSTLEGLTYAAVTLSDANLVAGNIRSGVSIFGVAGSYGGGTTLSGEWNSNTYTVTASPQGNTNSVTPVIHVDIPQSQPTYTARVWVATSTGSGSGYTNHGDPIYMYLVKNGLTVSLKSANSTSSGQTYAATTLSDANLIAGNIKSGVSIFGVAGSYAGEATLTGSWSSNTYTVTASPQGNTISVSPVAYVDIPQSQPTATARAYVATSASGESYTKHGDPAYMYLVKNGLTVSLKSANSTSSGSVYATTTLSDANLVAGNIKNGVSIFGVSGSYDGETTLSGSWSSNTYTVTASPQGDTNSVTPVIHVDIPQSQPTATARAWVATSTGSGSGYTNHGDPISMYLVKNNLTVSLKSANSTSSGQTYAATTLSDANLVAGNIKSGVSIFGVSGSYSGEATLTGSWSSNTYTVTASPQGSTNSVTPVIHVDIPQSQPTATARAWVATSTGSGSGYTNHGDPISMYLVKNNLTVSLKSANSTSSGSVYATTTLSDDNLVAGNIKSGVSIFGVTGTYSDATTLTGSWSSNTYTVTASPQGNTNSVTPVVHVDIPQSQPTNRARAYVATSSGGAYTNHGSDVSMYLVPNGLTVSLKSANSTSSGSVYAATTLNDANLEAWNIRDGVSIFGVTGTYSDATTLSGSWNSNTYTVTASPQGNTNSVTPVVRVDIPQSQPTATARAYVATSTGSGSGYTNHGDPAYMYLVKNGLTVSLKSANSTSSGSTYATTTLSDANLVAGNIKNGVSIFGVAGSFSGDTTLSGSWNSNTYTVTASPQGDTISVTPVVHVDIPQSQPTATARAYVATSTGSGSGYNNHGNPVSMYLVKNNLTVSLKSANSTSSGSTYATTTLSDANLVAGNIKSGVSIFGVAGSYSTDDAKNEVKINPFTASTVSSMTNYRDFTYTTDAPNPNSGTSRTERWFVVNAGVTTGSDNAQPGTLKAELRYGTSTGTTYARRNFTINHVELWNSDGTAQITSKTISSRTTFYPWCQVEGSWVKGSAVTITPSGSSYSNHESLYCTSITAGSTYTVKFTASMTPAMGSRFQTNKSYTMYWNWPS